jgi:hypothetical protein
MAGNLYKIKKSAKKGIFSLFFSLQTPIIVLCETGDVGIPEVKISEKTHLTKEELKFILRHPY